MSDKLTRKEIREPDPFVRVSRAFWAKAIEQRRPVGLGLGAAVLVFLGISLAMSAAKSRGVEAGAALSRAIELSRRPVEGATDLGASDPDAPKFKSFKEKNEELARKLDEVRKAYASTDAARSATILWADAQLNLGNLDEAAKGYAEFLAASPDDPRRALALEGQAYVLEGKKEWDRAAEAFDRMGQIAEGDALKARALVGRARALEQAGKKVEAASAFQKAKTEYKDAAASREAGDRLAMLAAQGISPPAAEAPPKAAGDAPVPAPAKK